MAVGCLGWVAVRWVVTLVIFCKQQQAKRHASKQAIKGENDAELLLLSRVALLSCVDCKQTLWPLRSPLCCLVSGKPWRDVVAAAAVAVVVAATVVVVVVAA